MRKIKTSIPLFILLIGTVVPIVGYLAVSLAEAEDLDHKYTLVFLGLNFGLVFILVYTLMDWITKKKKEVSIWTGIAMIVFGALFFIGILLLKPLFV
jgi:hypothetical protein